ncbi:hypothetical protein IHE50_00230 [Candidatus Parvarchaeota archaeon]|uniref:Uncharacterized protein n=1 Tax=Candidatus Acidifodinimicrobium mancum TaxID=2898728 RepID=A0A8T3UYE1_9ARCH|nr:hypothetical protein [Candidatus Acidifodinimicrobium mancum]
MQPNFIVGAAPPPSSNPAPSSRMPISYRIKNGIKKGAGKIRGALGRVPGVKATGKGVADYLQKRQQTKQSFNQLSPREKLAQIELSKMKSAKRRKGLGFGAMVLIVLLLIVGGAWFVLSGIASHTGVFSYQVGGFYGPYISSIESYTSSTFSMISKFLSNPEGYITDYFFPQTTVVTPPVTTFTSFVTITPPPSEQSLYITSSSSSPSNPPPSQNLEFVIGNSANLPLGSGYPNKLNLDITCAKGDNVCSNLTDLGNGKSFSPNVIFPGSEVQESAPIDIWCPTNNPSLAKELPVQSSVQIIANATNYTAASLLNLQYINSTFYNELLYSSQAYIPAEQATVVPSQGPLEVIPNLGESEPVASAQNASISIKINNLGSGNYALNNLTVYLPYKYSFYNGVSYEGYSFSSVVNMNKNSFDCSLLDISQNNQLDIVQNFAFPTYYYIKCWPTNLQQSSFLLELPNFTMPNEAHFETIPIIFQMNYNYTQTSSVSFYVINDTKCASS